MNTADVASRAASAIDEARSPVQTLSDLSFNELIELFSTLEAPAIEELDGEYAARPLAGPDAVRERLWGLAVANPIYPGLWQGKAFSGSGQGYNYFRQYGRIVRRFPMLNVVAPSRFDGAPAFQLVYEAFRSLGGAIRMVDEVRRAAPGVYLGLGTAGFTRSERMTPLPFVLAGPESSYAGDIGRRRDRVDLQRALTP